MRYSKKKLQVMTVCTNYQIPITTDVQHIKYVEYLLHECKILILINFNDVRIIYT